MIDAATIEMANTSAWLDALYHHCTTEHGELVFIEADKKRVHSAHRFGDLAAAARGVVGKRGLYLKINPMDAGAMRERSRRDGKGRYITGRASEVKTIVSFHLDCDAGKSSKYHSRSTMLWILGQMPHAPTLIVNSDGPDGGFHAYWILDRPHLIADEADRQRISKATVRWQNRLNELAAGKLDATANIDRVLRVFGGQRANGNRVTCHDYDPCRTYTLEQLTLPPSDQEIETDARAAARQAINETLGPCEASDQPITAYINASRIMPADLLREGGYIKLAGDQWLRPNAQTGARTLKLASKLDRPGINVFSGGDPNFSCLKTDGSVGAFYSVDSMFVSLRHDGNWKDAARWCHEQIVRNNQGTAKQ